MILTCMKDWHNLSIEPNLKKLQLLKLILHYHGTSFEWRTCQAAATKEGLLDCSSKLVVNDFCYSDDEQFVVPPHFSVSQDIVLTISCI